jgi:hypothetical protein
VALAWPASPGQPAFRTCGRRRDTDMKDVVLRLYRAGYLADTQPTTRELITAVDRLIADAQQGQGRKEQGR